MVGNPGIDYITPQRAVVHYDGAVSFQEACAKQRFGSQASEPPVPLTKGQ